MVIILGCFLKHSVFIFLHFKNSTLLIVEYPPAVFLPILVLAFVSLLPCFMPIVCLFTVWNISDKLSFR